LFFFFFLLTGGNIGVTRGVVVAVYVRNIFYEKKK